MLAEVFSRKRGIIGASSLGKVSSPIMSRTQSWRRSVRVFFSCGGNCARLNREEEGFEGL